MGSLNGIPWLVGIFLLLAINSDISHAQRRQSRLTSSRAFGISTKNTNSGSEFDCPEEFGYYPHPTDCTQYYVCVFGGALLESCTGGLMYSHELQTCDWPRNVGCEIVEGASPQQSETISQTQPGRDLSSRLPQVKSQSQQQSQQVQQQRIVPQTTAGPQRVRFQSPITTVAPQQLQQLPVQQSSQQQHQSQRTLSRQQSIPQPEFPAPNPIITSRGQPKSLLESQEDIAKLYAEAHDTLPPAEEEESDRQQRVYRGQPSTLGQVQRDRDGIIHHSNVNALPNHGKIGSFAFGSQISQFSDELQDLDHDKFHSNNKYRSRMRRDIENKNTTQIDVESTVESSERSEQTTEQTHFGDTITDTDVTGDEESNTTDYVRGSRQLRTSKYHSSWNFQPNLHLLPHLTAKAFRQGFPQNLYNPFLIPSNVQSSHSYKPNLNLFSNNMKLPIERPPNFNPSPSKPPAYNEFKPSAFYGYSQSGQVSDSTGTYKGFLPSTTMDSFYPFAPGRLQQKHSMREKDRFPETFSYFHIGQAATSTPRYETPSPVLSPPYKVTPKGQFTSGSTVGGFYNNNNHGNTAITNNFKKPPQFKVPEPFSTTQSNYFAYNILQNQKMKQYYITTTPMTPIISTQPPVTNIENDFLAVGYYPKDTKQKLQSLATVVKYKIPEDKPVESSVNVNSYPGQVAVTTIRPTTRTKSKTTATKKPLFQMPVAGGSFDFEKFVAGIRDSHIAQVDPSIMDTLNFFKYTLLRKNQSTTARPSVSNTSKNQSLHHLPSTTIRPIFERERTTHRVPTTKLPKGYDSFINSIPKKSKPFTSPAYERPNYSVSNGSQVGLTGTSSEYYYDDEHGDFDYDVVPPSQKPPYMPMSETMAPKLPRPTSSTKFQDYKTTKSRLPVKDEATTSAYTFSLVESTEDADQNQKIPSFISFPPDIFQRIPAMSSIRQKLKNLTLSYSTPESFAQTRPFTLKTASTSGSTTTTSAPSTTRTTTTIPTTTTTRKIYTIRPRTHLPPKSKPNKLTNILKRPEQQQILKEAKYKYSTTPQPSNIFVQQPQQQRPKPVAEPQNTRNTYYNTSNQAYDPATYDSFYSVYDDDVELYRDLEYNNQHQQQQQQQSQYNSGQRTRQQSTVQPTYRPEIVTTPTPQVPVRETYVSKQQTQQQNAQQQQDTTYNKPSLNYNTEYDDALISQIDDQAFNQPSRNPPVRGDQYDLNSISDSYSSIRTTNPTRFAPIFHPPTTTTTATTTTRYRPSTTVSTTPSTTPSTTTTTTTYRPTTIRTTQSTTTSTTTTTTTPPPQTTTSSTITTTTDQTTTKSARSTRMQEIGDTNNRTGESESIVISLTAAVSSRNQHTTTPSTTTTTTTTKRTTTVATSTTTSTQGKLYDSNRSGINTNSSPKYAEIPSRVRNVQILNESPISDSTEKQLTYSSTIDSLTQNQPKQANQTDSDSHISLSLSRGFSTASLRLPFESSSSSGQAGKKSYLGFQIAEEEPQGFKLPPTSPSARLSPVIVIPQEKLEGEKNFEFSLSSGVALNNKATPFSKGTVEEVPLPIYSRREESIRPEATKVVVDPTTYAPNRHWRFAKTSTSSFFNQDKSYLHELSDNKEAHSQYSFRRAHINGLEANKEESEISEKFQGFTAKAQTFKDSLHKNTDSSSSSRFVSPFKSLEALLAEKEENGARKSFNRVNANTPLVELETTTSQKPFRSYFLITQPPKQSTTTTTTTTTTTLAPTVPPLIEEVISTTVTTTSAIPTTTSTVTPVTEASESPVKSTTAVFYQNRKAAPSTSFRGRSRYTFNYNENFLENDEPTTYSPKHRFSTPGYAHTTPNPYRLIRTRPVSGFRGFSSRTSSAGGRSRYEFSALRVEEPQQIDRAAYNTESQSNDTDAVEIQEPKSRASSSTEQLLVEVTERPSQFFSNYRNLATERLLAESIQHASEPVLQQQAGQDQEKFRASVFKTQPVRQQDVEFVDEDREKFRATVEMPEFNIPTEKEIQLAVEAEEVQDNLGGSQATEPHYTENSRAPEIEYYYELETESPQTTQSPIQFSTSTYRYETTATTTTTPQMTTTTPQTTTTNRPFTPSATTSPPPTTTFAFASTSDTFINEETDELTTPTTTTSTTSSTTPRPTTTRKSTTSSFPLPPRASRVNNAIKSSIAASSRKRVPSSAYAKCGDNSLNAKCNEIPSRSRTRGGVTYNSGLNSQNGNERETSQSSGQTNRGTPPPRSRPTLKSKGTIVSKAAEFIDIYKNPPSRPEPLYPQPTPDKTAAKCRKDVCLLPDCSCGGKDIPGDLPVETLPQIVLLTFDDSVNDLNKQLYTDLFEKGRVNPNGCPITATFYVSHEWTDYSQVQNLYSDGHEMASHTVSHSFGEQFSQKKWTREIAGQREILSAYGGVKLSDVRGMRAPFLSIGGNKMFKMLYDSNFTYDSSMPVYENRPPSWPYTLDYKIFHDCMIPPCPTKSYPGVWEVPMVMWQDLNGGRCSMGDACANPSEAENVTKMLMKNFDRHYTTNRAPFGLFYHAAWFTQPHHKEGFIKFLDTINAMDDVWIITNWQMLQWVRDPTPLSRIKQFQPFQCDYSDRPKRCNNPKVCNLWHKSGVRYMRTCQPCPDIYPWTGKTGIRSSRIDNDIEE